MNNDSKTWPQLRDEIEAAIRARDAAQLDRLIERARTEFPDRAFLYLSRWTVLCRGLTGGVK